jgi:hypothetical protein
MRNILKAILIIVGLCVITYLFMFVVENRHRVDPCKSYKEAGKPCPIII